MNKKLTAFLTAGVLALALIFPSACGKFGTFTADTSFPYDAATERGEEGSRESWLASLTTPSTELRRAYEEAIEDGSFTGTYFEFLKETGAQNSGDRIQEALFCVVDIYALFESREKKYYSAGAGIIYDLDTQAGDAVIVTNYHVVYNASSKGTETVAHISDSITLALYGEDISSRPIDATFVGGSMKHDIAVLRVEDCAFLKDTPETPVYAHPVVAADSDSISVGEDVYAIGNADGKGMSVTKGVLSVDAEYITITAADDKTLIDDLLVMRTDAAVNHGNSGGGLFNAEGELIGIVNARDESDGIVAFGYAIPANWALALAQNILDTCAADARNRGAAIARIGVTFQAQDAHSVFDAESGKALIEEKLVVTEVEYKGKADNAGVKDGDTLMSATLNSTRGGEPYARTVYLTRRHKVGALFMDIRLGDSLTLTVSRGGQFVDILLVFDDKDDFTLYD